MEQLKSAITVSAPGRICLFGEHQDYLGFKVISSAIDRRISVSGNPIKKMCLEIELPDIGGCEVIDIGNENRLKGRRDYLRSTFNLLKRMGIGFDTGYKCRIQSTIPVRKGVSSSSALVVAWTKFLISISDEVKNYSSFHIAKLAFRAEVEEFNEPGGMQDHLCAALGGLLFMDFSDEVHFKKIERKLSGFVLADSLVKKDTIGVLSRIKGNFFKGLEIMNKEIPNFDVHSFPADSLRKFREKIGNECYKITQGALKIRDLTQESIKEIENSKTDENKIGELFNRHHEILRDNLSVSTPVIDKLIDVSLRAGAKGAKVNGSGGGGCFVAYCPGKEKEVITAIKKSGGNASEVRIDEGVRLIC